MSDRPILFNTEMVRAIIDGRKTQTRRLVKNIPLQEPYFEVVNGTPYVCDVDGEWHPAVECSPIQEGDVLYVRETWAKVPGTPPYIYKSTFGAGERKWRPSIHMPKDAARLFLRVTDVRMEQLQDISPSDIDAEGCKEYAYISATGELLPSGPTWFKILWDKTIKPVDLPRFGWDANPWVWVIEFERTDKPFNWA